MTDHRPLNLRRAIELAAPHTWPASVLPVLLGTLLPLGKDGGLRGGVCLLVLAAAVSLQSAVNTFNDVRDLVRGTDTAENCLNESDAAMLFGNLSPRSGLALGGGFLLLAAACGVGAALMTDWRLWYFGLAAALAIALYALWAADMPLGELLSGLSMGGVLPMAAYFAQCGRCDWASAYLFIPSVLTVACIMLTNNTADVLRDAATGRRTLAVRIGAQHARRLLCALLPLAAACAAACILWRFPAGWPVLPVMLVGALLAARPLYLGPVAPETRDRSMAAALGAHCWITGGYAAAVAVALL